MIALVIHSLLPGPWFSHFRPLLGSAKIFKAPLWPNSPHDFLIHRAQSKKPSKNPFADFWIAAGTIEKSDKQIHLSVPYPPHPTKKQKHPPKQQKKHPKPCFRVLTVFLDAPDRDRDSLFLFKFGCGWYNLGIFQYTFVSFYTRILYLSSVIFLVPNY